MAATHYLWPLASAASPPAEAVRLVGGMAFASHFALITRTGGAITARARYSRSELEAALPALPPAVREQWNNLRRTPAPLFDGARHLPLDRALVMGILNLTPDSFSDGGCYDSDPAMAEAHAEAMRAAGALIIDIGGESTRPGAAPVSEAEELRRVIPLTERLAAGGAVISIDTRRAAVMEAALAAGAHIINDVSALRHDPRSVAVAARSGAPVVLMHAPGRGDDLHRGGVYADAVLDVFDWLAARRDAALEAGVARSRIVLDPGIGFGKSAAENLALINALPLFHALGQPLMLGASRKRMIAALAGDAPPRQRLGGSLALALRGLDAGVHILRVHDVAETVQAQHLWSALREAAAG